MTVLKVAQNSVSVMLSVYNLFTWSFHQQVNMSKLRYVNRIVKNFEKCPLSSIQNFRFLLQHWRPLLFSIICRFYLVYVLLLWTDINPLLKSLTLPIRRNQMERSDDRPTSPAKAKPLLMLWPINFGSSGWKRLNLTLERSHIIRINHKHLIYLCELWKVPSVCFVTRLFNCTVFVQFAVRKWPFNTSENNRKELADLKVVTSWESLQCTVNGGSHFFLDFDNSPLKSECVVNTVSVLEITVGHRTLSDQISKLSDQFCHMVGHDVWTRKTSVPLKILFSDYICFKTILKW